MRMMKVKNILYIGAALLLAGCSNETELTSDTLSGGAKTPLNIQVSLGTDNPITRASGNKFDKDDVLKVYMQHVAKNGSDVYESKTIPDSRAPKLISLSKLSDAGMVNTDVDAVKSTSDLTTIYWDDFSHYSADGSTDLRTSGHGLRAYYGYCYNGKTPEPTLTDEAAGTLNWTVATDQSASATTVQQQDLLWAPTSNVITYTHNNTQNSDHSNALVIPFTHAMSQVTVKVIANAGFTTSNPLVSTGLTLNNMNTEASLTAPTSTINNSTTLATIQMLGATYSSGNNRTYTAIIAPKTKLKEGELLLDITDVDGNNYKVYITEAMLIGTGLPTGSTPWNANETLSEDEGKKYIETKPGYNYYLTVTVDKAQVDTKATLREWYTVSAEGTGEIQLDPNADDNKNITIDDSKINPNSKSLVDITSLDNGKFQNDSEFTLCWVKSNEPNDIADNAPLKGYTYATTSKFSDKSDTDHTNDEWINTPTLYWPNASDNYYFRAIAKYKGKVSDNKAILDDVEQSLLTEGIDNTYITVNQGTIDGGYDILWGTTALHKGKNSSTNAETTYYEGQAIPPRKGGVPIAFQHAMSKITINLKTTNVTDVTVNNAKVNLTNASIAINNLSTSGSMAIKTGTITPATNTTDVDISGNVPGTITSASTEAAALSEYIVIPQNIPDNAILTITLSDGTTYKKQLNTCVDSSNNVINTWAPGTYYTYTIELTKEEIKFRVLIKDWETVTGSGNATMEWD